MDARELRVMSFNVRGSFRKKDGINVWKNRSALNVEVIKKYGPTLIGFQEAQRGNLKTYRESLPGYELLRGPRYGNRARRPSFNAILFDPDRLEVEESGGFWLSETPQKYSASWNTRVIRSAHWAVFRCKPGDSSFLYLNTHLDHRSKLARREGSKLIVLKVNDLLERRGEERPAILTGDFNCKPGSIPHRTFIEGGFLDTFLASSHEDTADAYTFHAFKGPSFPDNPRRKAPRRMDWVMVRDPEGRFEISSHRILRDADESAGLYPSDHYPVLAGLLVR